MGRVISESLLQLGTVTWVEPRKRMLVVAAPSN